MRQTAFVIAIGVTALFCITLLYRHFIIKNAAKTKQQVGTLPNTAKLRSFFWHQSAESTDACFTISFDTVKNKEALKHYFSCAFCAPNGEAAEYTNVPISDARWSELEAELRSLTLPTYAPPYPYLMDATDSCIEVCWENNGNCFFCRYNGEYAHELHSFLLTLIEKIAK